MKIISAQSIEQHLQQQYLFYAVIGQEPYLAIQAIQSIKQYIIKNQIPQVFTFDLQQSSDWDELTTATREHNLFSEKTLIIARYDKKTLDTSSKHIISHFFTQPSSHCIIIFCAPLITKKSWEWLNQNQALIITADALSVRDQQQWIKHQFNRLGLKYSQEVPDAIITYTTSNLSACAQLLEKLAINHQAGDTITGQIILNYLDNQSDYSLFALTDACLKGDLTHALFILKQHHQAEPSLLLWHITREIRNLIQLTFQRQQGVSLSAACQSLNIWSSRVPLYQQALSRLTLEKLHCLLHLGQQCDQLIKSYQLFQFWINIEQIIVELTVGKTLCMMNQH